MDQSDLQDQLMALATTGPRRISKMERLRSVFPLVEAALDAGASRQEVLNLLNNAGYELTLVCFKSYLQRIRRDSRGPKESFQKRCKETIRPIPDPRGCSARIEGALRTREMGSSSPTPTQSLSTQRPSMGDFLVPRAAKPPR